MTNRNLFIRLFSILLICAGLALLLVNLVFHLELNFTLPLLFLVLGGGFFLVLPTLREKWRWAVYLYIPGFLMTAFGVIFLLNVTTGDWRSWAYAWLLLPAAIGIGLLLANRELNHSPVLNLIGWGLAIAGITFFAVFGAITGGMFIQVITPVLLVAVGLSFRWLLPAKANASRATTAAPLAGSARTESGVPFLAEALSVREIEVLRLIDQGLTNAQVADRLVVAQSTVKTHINNIYSKMGVQTRVQALNRARELKLI
jgi:DNA-binding CsgD family transcriptional regulator